MSEAARPLPAAQRELRVDALRAFALAGILQVNIQSFVQGAGRPLGEFLSYPSWLDRAAYFLVSAFFEYKFMPIFGMLFGAGFGLLWSRLPSATARPRLALARRYGALLVFGIAHGLLVYYGDITNVYAVLGFLLLAVYGRADAAQLARSVRRWWIAAVVLSVALTLLVDLTGAQAGAAVENAQRLAANFVLFTTGSYAAQLPARAQEFAAISTVVYAYGQWVPVFAWMLTGLLAQRAGWLSAPFGSPRAERRIVVLGLGVGLPCALAYAWVSLAAALDGPFVGAGAPPAAWPAILVMASSLLAPMYALLFLRHAPARLCAWMAPAGRMPLTNYLLQSLAMGALLSGWGLGWGAHLGHAALAAVAAAIVVAQWHLARLWLRRFDQGPLEAAWRTLTYAGLPPAALKP